MKKHLNELQVYSGIAIIFVTLIHGNAYYLLNVLKLQSYIDAGIFFNFIDKIVHIAVPMFIFIAGYKFAMNNRNEKYVEFLIKKVQTILLPFLTVSLCFLFLRWGSYFFKHFILERDTSLKFMIYNFFKELILIFFGTNGAYQLWYIPMFLLIILTYPLLLKYINDSRLRLSLFIFLSITWGSIVGHIHIPYLSSILNSPALEFVYYLYLYELGSIFYINKWHLKNGKKVILLYMIILLLSSLMKNNIYSSIFTTIVLNPLSVMAFYYISVMIKDNKLLLILGKYSFYIYLFHEPFFISRTSSFIQTHGLYKSGLIAPFVSILSIILSIFLYKVLEKVYIARCLLGIKHKNTTIKYDAKIQAVAD